ncbi:hypothetical protein R1N04_21210, partial [Klebsiella sp. 76256]|uniref:hypothetical protein n=1 Tax=Klebsiella TaxID=570 RepID=UPI0022407D40
EWVHVQLHQQKGMISLSPPTICNSARDFTECPGAMQWRGMKKNEKAAMRRLFSQPAAIICTNRR